MAQVTKEDVLRVARLARLTLDEQDAEAMTAHFTKVLAYIEKLTVLPTDDIEPATHAVTVAADTSAVVVSTASAVCNGGGAAMSAYFAEAHPVTVGSTGQRSFGTDTRGTIYFKNDGTTVAAGMAGASVLQ